MPLIALTFQRPISDPRTYISNPYGNWYQIRAGVWNYHCAIDIVFQEGSIAHARIDSVAWGSVTYAARVTVPGFDVWGNLIVVRSILPDGKVVYCRYAHVENMRVKTGDIVYPGQHIADVGNAFGAYAYHLDFSISPTNVLAVTPWDWPGTDLARVYRDYIDPCSFIGAHEQMANDFTTLNAALNNLLTAVQDLKTAVQAFEDEDPNPEPLPVPATVINQIGANIRLAPTIYSTILVEVPVSTKLTVKDSGVDKDNHRWMQVVSGPEKAIGGYVAKDLLSFP